MAEIKVDNAKMQQIRDQLPEMSSKLSKDMAALASNLDVIRKNIDSDGINIILTKFNESISSIKNDIVGNLGTAQEYLTNKLAGYQTVASRTDDQLSKVNALLQEMELND